MEDAFKELPVEEEEEAKPPPLLLKLLDLGMAVGLTFPLSAIIP